MILDLGCGDLPTNWIPNSEGVDMFDYGQAHTFNLEETPWPLKSNKYNLVVAQHILEHIKDGYAFINIFNEIWRVSKNNAVFSGACPYFPTSPNYFRDPTHCRPINEHSFDMFLVDSPIHAGSGYNIICAFEKIAMHVNHNQDLVWKLKVVK